MRARLTAALLIAAAVALGAADAGAGQFGFKEIAVRFQDSEGHPSMQAGSHPFALETELKLNTEEEPELGREIASGQLKDLSGAFSAGLSGSPYAVPQCTAVEFATTEFVEGITKPGCSDSSVIGLISNRVALADSPVTSVNPVYNLVPPPGVAARFGFLAYGGTVPPVAIDIGIEDTPPYRLTYKVANVTQIVSVFSADLTIWGNPSSSAHDEDRGACGLFLILNGFPAEKEGTCPVSQPEKPQFTLPRSCVEPVSASFLTTSWQGDSFFGEAHTEGAPEGCARLGLPLGFDAQPTSEHAESPSGLDFHLDVSDPGVESPAGIAESDLKKAVVTLPEGVTINPSQAEGLAVCSEADFAREGAFTEFGEGCPAASKIGTVEVETPLLEGKILKGSLFVAAPYENRFGTLIALYMTFREPQLGVGIKLAGKVEPDPRTGQLVATFDELPQQPFSHFRLHFREGGRSSLITPPACGAYATTATFTPWANPGAPVQKSSSFQITGGVGGGPCPSGSRPFEPGFEAGTQNNDAGSYSPFQTRITRRDGDQDLTKFSASLPEGLLARLAGVSRCPDAQIAAAKAKSGRAELASPSCPLDSQVGTLQAGAGVGSELTYVKGRVYLAGPYNGAPLSIVEIVPAVAGPFDVGDVVVRQALDIDPRTARVRVDGDRSDPIPHILAGIPLRVRDIQVSIDRSEFTLNPTSCDPTRIEASLWGGGENPFSTLDDSPVAREQRFQAANCRALGFGPRLWLKLRGGTRRGAHPALRAVVRPRPGDANIQGAVVRLPHSAFLEQAHIRTICTRVQFAAGAGHGAGCPKGSVYGRVRAFTPLLSEPLEGPVYLRSSNHNLPDMVFALHGLVDFEAVGRIDSKHGGIRATFTEVPDAPISKVVLNMRGAKKGLIVNSTNLCAKPHRAAATFTAHNAKRAALHPLVRASCPKRHANKRHHRR